MVCTGTIIRVKIYHILENEARKYGQIILDEEPLFVGFSVLTGFGIKSAVALSRIIKSSSNIPVVWGNVHPSLLPEQCLQEDYVDIVCIGEGEETCIELVQAVESNESLRNIKGIGYKETDGQIKINEGRPFIENLDKYEIDWSLVDIERYITPDLEFQRTLCVIASRGCPYNCTFCFNQAFYQRRWRTHTADYMINQISALAKRYNIEAFYFNDSNFFVNQKWAWEILEGIDIPYFSYLRTEYVNEEFAGRLVSTNCIGILFGHESGSEKVLKEVLKKGSTVEDSIAATEILSKYPQIRIIGSFMGGLPGETKDDFNKTIKLMCNLLEIHPNISLMLRFLLPLPGTELYDTSIKKGFSPPLKTEDWSVFDFYSDKIELPWVDRVTSKKIEGMCKAMGTLDMIYKFKVPFLKQIVRRMVLNENYNNFLLTILNKLRLQYAFGKRYRALTYILRIIVNAVKKLKRIK